MRALLLLLHTAFATQKMSSDAIVSALWRFKCLRRKFGEIFCMQQNSKVSG